GSLVALSAVIAGLLIRDHGGARATTTSLFACSIAAIAAAGLVGAFSGAMITFFRVPPFIATLGMMQVASGLAYIFSAGQSIYDIPQSFTALSRNGILLLAIIYILAHVIMSRTKLGRYIYAVGGNPEAARLSGVRVGLTVVESYRQKVVLGLVILGAVLLDMLKKRTWKLPRWLRPVDSAKPIKESNAAIS